MRATPLPPAARGTVKPKPEETKPAARPSVPLRSAEEQKRFETHHMRPSAIEPPVMFAPPAAVSVKTEPHFSYSADCKLRLTPHKRKAESEFAPASFPPAATTAVHVRAGTEERSHVLCYSEALPKAVAACESNLAAGVRSMEEASMFSDQPSISALLNSAALSDAFQLKLTPVPRMSNADFLLAGVYSVAFVVAFQNEILFEFTRTPLIERMRAVRSGFKDAFVLAIVNWSCALPAVSKLQSIQDVPPVLLVPTIDAAIDVMKTFAKLATKERDQQSVEYRKALNDSVQSRDKALQILSAVDLTPTEASLLLDVYGTLQTISAVTKRQILDETPLPEETCKALDRFFRSP